MPLVSFTPPTNSTTMTLTPAPTSGVTLDKMVGQNVRTLLEMKPGLPCRTARYVVTLPTELMAAVQYYIENRRRLCPTDDLISMFLAPLYTEKNTSTFHMTNPTQNLQHNWVSNNRQNI